MLILPGLITSGRLYGTVVSFCVLSLIVVVPDNRAVMGYQEIFQTTLH